MKFTDRQKSIKKERQYAEKRFNQLLEQVDQIPAGTIDSKAEEMLIELDLKWQAFWKNLIYITPEAKGEFIKVARERAYKTTNVNA